jgi:hypothetical protein
LVFIWLEDELRISADFFSVPLVPCQSEITLTMRHLSRDGCIQQELSWLVTVLEIKNSYKSNRIRFEHWYAYICIRSYYFQSKKLLTQPRSHRCTLVDAAGQRLKLSTCNISRSQVICQTVKKEGKKKEREREKDRETSM